MSTELAKREMQRFLSNSAPEVLSISGRWGVGKTFGWAEALKEARNSKTLGMKRYAYVSVFGVKNLDDLKSTIFQSTVKLDHGSIEPNLDSFWENIKTIAEHSGRKGASLATRLISALPYVGKTSDLILPGASLLIREQIVCIDDIERSSDGLDIHDILGFVSMLREERRCKVILLLNEEGLGESRDVFQKFMEKVVDQAIRYEPTPRQSTMAALDQSNELEASLAHCFERLGTTNIRVIKRIYRYLSFLVPSLEEKHESVTRQAVESTALLGWCLFEPAVAPNLKYVRNFNEISQRLAEEGPTPEEARWNALLSAYGFRGMDEFDLAILEGLQAGGFDIERIQTEACRLDETFARADDREGAQKPWQLLGDSFDDNEAAFKEALISSVENHALGMTPKELNDVVTTLKYLECEAEVDRLVSIYVESHGTKSRQFFDLSRDAGNLFLDVSIRSAFGRKLGELPPEKSPKELLLEIDQEGLWHKDEAFYLSTMSTDDYYELLKSVRGDELRSIVRAGLQFEEADSDNEISQDIGRMMRAALTQISEESRLNAMRLRPYIGRDE